MKKYAWIAVITLGVCLLGPQSAFAKKKGGGEAGGDAKGGFAAMDTDSSGEVSLEEFMAAKPKAKEAAFTKLDKDSSGGLNEEEVAAGGKKKGAGKKKDKAGAESGDE